MHFILNTRFVSPPCSGFALSWKNPKLLLLFSIVFIHLQLITVNSFAQYSKLLDFGNVDNGSYPYSTPLSDGIFLYGMTSDGGTNHRGTIFKVKPDGSSFTKIHDFDEINGSNPYGSLVSDGTFLYGMTRGGGLNSQGIVFKIKSDGTGFTKLLDFNYATTGGFPYGSLIYDGTFLYGMTNQGGSNLYGTIFKIMPNGTGFVKLFDFDYTNTGGNPRGSLFSDGTFLYGMTTFGGPTDSGTIFKIMPDGTGFTKLLDFDGTSKGGNPLGDFISDGTFLYGMTFYGGSNFGTLFKIKPDGTSFARIFDFSNSSTGSYPKGTLVYDGTFLYGTTSQGGINFSGSIFKIKPDGSGFIKLMDSVEGSGGFLPEGTLLMSGTSLIATKPSGGNSGLGSLYKINTDGTNYTKLFSYEVSENSPTGSLISDGTFLYGMAARGGANNFGTIFKIKSDGTGFVRLFDFNGTVSGAVPNGSLFSDGTFFYGMTSQGGANDVGTIFKIKIDGTGFSKLLDLDYPTVGANPSGSLISDGTFLYGVNSGGGSNNYGVIFKIKTDGTGFSKLLDFDYVNNGATPNGPLISDGTFLYGVTNGGGVNGSGAIFKIKMDGTGFVKLQDMDYPTGGNSYGSLFSDGTFLYGMATSGGLNGNGTVFKIKSDGTGFTTMFDFENDITGNSPNGTLISDGTYLYGMTPYGGVLNAGIVFKIKTDGTNYSKLIDFNDGTNARGSLLSDGTFLYGMTSQGGVNGLGILFKRSFAPATMITNFIPAEGVEGTTVIINGIDFDPIPINNTVKFNNTAAIVKSSTANTLTVVVPVGATSGSISVTANGVATSLTDFDVTTEAIMINGSIQNCDVAFLPPTYQYIQDNNYDEIIETFSPISLSDKVKVSFSSINLQSDALYVYDGPTPASPLIATLRNTNSPTDITATGPSGELTFVYVWGDGSTDWDATISCQSSTTITACDIPFLDPGGNSDYPSDQDIIETFAPVNALDKIRVSFSSFSTEDGFDSLSVYDGPSTSSPLIAVLSGDISPADITATGSGGELTFVFRSDGDVERSGWDAFISCVASNTPAPTITNFNPTSGTVGTIVTITGTNFDPVASNNTVRFNGTVASVTASTATSITVTVPTSATSGPISVTVGSSTATSATNFCVLPSTEIVSITTDGTELTASSGDSYQWYYFGNFIQGATNQSITYSILEYGEYGVDVVRNGCPTRADYIYLITSQHQEPVSTIQVFPNPVKESLFVNLPEADFTLKIIDPLGRVFQEQRATKGSNELKMSDLPSGLYYLVAKSHDDVIVFKVQKQ